MPLFSMGVCAGVVLAGTLVLAFGGGTGRSTFTACNEKGYVVLDGVPYKCHFEEMKP